MSGFVVSAVPADSLAQLGARIYRHNADQDQVPDIYDIGTWRVSYRARSKYDQQCEARALSHYKKLSLQLWGFPL